MSSRTRDGLRVLQGAARTAALATILAALAAVTGWLMGDAVTQVVGDPHAKWVLARSAGITGYALLIALVSTGLVLAHPWRSRIRMPSTTARIRLHIGLAAFTLVFITLHIVILAVDEYAGVGWKGAVLPFGSEYRPLPVTLGVLGFYAGLVAGLTALISTRLALRVWLPIHRVAIVSLVLVWVHGVMAGSDTPTLLVMYVLSGAAVVALAVSRYVTSSPSDQMAQLVDEESVRTTVDSYATGGRS